MGVGLRRVNIVDPCVNSTCVGKADWVDGTPFAWQSWMDEQINLQWTIQDALCLRAVPGPGHLFTVVSRYCSGKDHVTVCEKSCIV